MNKIAIILIATFLLFSCDDDSSKPKWWQMKYSVVYQIDGSGKIDAKVTYDTGKGDVNLQSITLPFRKVIDYKLDIYGQPNFLPPKFSISIVGKGSEKPENLQGISMFIDNMFIPVSETDKVEVKRKSDGSRTWTMKCDNSLFRKIKVFSKKN